MIDTNGYKNTGIILLKVQPGTDAAFEGKLFKSLSNAIGSSIEIEHLDKKLVSKNKFSIYTELANNLSKNILILIYLKGLYLESFIIFNIFVKSQNLFFYL